MALGTANGFSAMSKIDALIQEFVINLRQAIAQEAAEAFAIAGGGGVGSVGNGRRKPGPNPISAKRTKGGKRTVDLDLLQLMGEWQQIFAADGGAPRHVFLGADIGPATATLLRSRGI